MSLVEFTRNVQGRNLHVGLTRDIHGGSCLHVGFLGDVHRSGGLHIGVPRNIDCSGCLNIGFAGYVHGRRNLSLGLAGTINACSKLLSRQSITRIVEGGRNLKARRFVLRHVRRCRHLYTVKGFCVVDNRRSLGSFKMFL